MSCWYNTYTRVLNISQDWGFCLFCTCTDWLWRRLPTDLKSFLLDGEAEWYNNITVKYLKNHKTTILTVYEDGKPVDEINFRYLDGKEEYHKAFIDSGFELKTQEELEKDPRYRKYQKEKEFVEQRRLRQEKLQEARERMRSEERAAVGL